MDIFGIGAATSGTMQAIGGVTSAYMSAKYAKEMQEKQLKWERERATHAHQWEVQDLKAAGLNPILSAGGSGAVTGGISAPVPDMSGIQQAATGIGEALRLGIEMKKAGADINNTNANTALQIQQQRNEAQTLELLQEQTLSEMARRGLVSSKRAQIELDNIRKKFENEHQSLTYWNDFINRATGSAKNLTDAGTGIFNNLIKKVDKGGQFKHEYSEFGNGWRETWRD